MKQLLVVNRVRDAFDVGESVLDGFLFRVDDDPVKVRVHDHGAEPFKFGYELHEQFFHQIEERFSQGRIVQKGMRRSETRDRNCIFF